MAALENLPPDQRAVVQLVLLRGRSYDEIARLLSIDRAAVRRRALDAFDALAPAVVLPGPERGLVTDYLLEQLPEKVAEQVFSFLQVSNADRLWAEAVVDAISPLVSRSLPEIPAGAPPRADDWSVGGPDPPSDAAATGAGPAVQGDDEPADPVSAPRTAPVTPVTAVGMWQPVATKARGRAEAQAASEQAGQAPRRSRRGSALLLGVVCMTIAAAMVIALTDTGPAGGKRHASTTHPSSAGPGSRAGTTRTPGTTRTTSTIRTTGTNPIVLARLELKSSTGAPSAVGIVQVVRARGVLGVVIEARGVPANTAHNAYAVWLYNSPASHRRVGFVPNLVGRSGKLITDGRLPADAAAYHRILITLETQPDPARPGKVVLAGTFREHP